jgi:hypothetical protein
VRSESRICQAIVCRLGDEVRPEGLEHGTEAEYKFVARVLSEEGCTPTVFERLDSKPGHYEWNGYQGYHGEWHHTLRRFRNNASRELFNKALDNQG